MQNQALIPTPLIPEHKARKVIEIVEPTASMRFRLFKVLWFILGTIALRFASRLWPKRYGGDFQARRLRAFMEEMGGLWVKAGQIVALRRDLFSESFCLEISKLQDRARGFPFHYAKEILEQELGGPIAETFSEFDEKPLAAASIGQAYRARLRSPDVEVVVKVQRPYIRDSFERDLRLLRRLCETLERMRAAPHFRWTDMYWELDRAILEELDYQQEAASLRRMRKSLRKHKIYVPRAFQKYCTDRVLVMELVRGVYMSDYIKVAASEPGRVEAWCQENQISSRRAGERLLFSHFQQLFEDNLYHCDLHPGNILLMRKSRITLIDFGSIGNADKTQLRRMVHLFSAVGNRDYAKAADLYLLISPSLPNRDLSGIKEQVVRLFRDAEPLTKIKTVPYHQKSIGRISGEITQILSANGVPASWDMLRSLRAELTLDASLMFLVPEIDYPKVIRRYMGKMRARQQKKLRSGEHIRRQLAKLSEAADLPKKMVESAYFEGEYLRRRTVHYEGTISRAARAGRYCFLVLSRLLFLIAGICGIGLLHQRYNSFASLPSEFVQRVLHRLPQLETEAWVAAILVALYLSSDFSAVRRVLEQPEPTMPSGDRR
jgi:ubiquinone biosynthesis protein